MSTFSTETDRLEAFSDGVIAVIIALYVVAVAAAFFSPVISDVILVGVAVMWLVPDRRFEPLINRRDEPE